MKLKLAALCLATQGLIFAQNAIVRQLSCVDAGSTDSYACSLPVVPTGYVTGVFYWFQANTSNTGSASLNLNSLGAKTIVKVAGGITTPLADNDIRAGQWVQVIYDGVNMQMTSQLGNSGGGGGGGGNAYTVVGSGASPSFVRTQPNQTWNFTMSPGGATGGTTTGIIAGDLLFFVITQCSTAGGCNFTWPSGLTGGCTIAAGDPLTGTANLTITQQYNGTGASTAIAVGPCVTSATTNDLMYTDKVNTMTEITAPGGTPSAGTETFFADAVANFLRSKNAAGATFQMAKELTANSIRKAGGPATADAPALWADISALAIGTGCGTSTNVPQLNGNCTAAGGTPTVIGEGWYPAAPPANNTGAYPLLWSSSTSSSLAKVSANNTLSGVVAPYNSGAGTGYAQFGFWLPPTWGGTFVLKVWHTLGVNINGTGTMQLNIQVQCYNPGTTDVSVAYSLNTGTLVAETFTGTNYKQGFYGTTESVSPSTSGCAASDWVVVRFTRTATGTATDDSIIYGAYVTLH